MTRLIDADALKYKNLAEVNGRLTYVLTAEEIDNAPTVLFPLTVKIKDNVTDDDIEVLKRLMRDYKPQVLNLETERPKGEWVPVSERLPEKNGYYLVTRKGFSIKNHVKRVGYDANTKRWSEGSIIAWQPLPEPYKKGDAE